VHSSRHATYRTGIYHDNNKHSSQHRRDTMAITSTHHDTEETVQALNTTRTGTFHNMHVMIRALTKTQTGTQRHASDHCCTSHEHWPTLLTALQGQQLASLDAGQCDFAAACRRLRCTVRIRARIRRAGTHTKHPPGF
jgi:hypothetical protein